MSLQNLTIWAALFAVMVVPVVLAGFSPYLGYRTPMYITAGFAGIIGLSLFALQPLLAARILPHIRPRHMRSAHRWVGVLIAVCVVVHVGGLYLVSPQDTLDALTFQAPTWFSIFGVIALWSLVVAVIFVALRRTRWRAGHKIATALLALATITHALLIEGAMELVSKWALCLVVLAVLAFSLLPRRKQS